MLKDKEYFQNMKMNSKTFTVASQEKNYDFSDKKVGVHFWILCLHRIYILSLLTLSFCKI